MYEVHKIQGLVSQNKTKSLKSSVVVGSRFISITCVSPFSICYFSNVFLYFTPIRTQLQWPKNKIVKLVLSSNMPQPLLHCGEFKLQVLSHSCAFHSRFTRQRKFVLASKAFIFFKSPSSDPIPNFSNTVQLPKRHLGILLPK